MSELKLISPMLDRYLLGSPISDHDGIRCCPAMNKDTEEKFIVKIMSIPASQDRLEAFLLTGIYPDKESALAYFKGLADEAVAEIQLLEKLSGQEGFIPYDDHQVVSMEDGEVGYDIYMISPYLRSLKKIQQRETVTHLTGFNLGYDICIALEVCRQNGFIFTNLKPSNIFRTDAGTFKISDFGFVSTSGLAYSYLDKRYVSSYTAPELTDEFTCLNTTADIYSLGAILYEVFNGGSLPESGDLSQPPMYADYELSEIILKACAVNPADRWQTPAEMGQALADYMKRNGVNNDPIIPIATDIPQAASDAPAEHITEEAAPEEVPQEADSAEAIVAEEAIAALVDETAPENTISEVSYTEVSDELSQILSYADDLMAAPVPEAVVAPEPVEVSLPQEEIAEETAISQDEPVVEPQPEETVIEEPAAEEATEEATDAVADEAAEEDAEESEEAEAVVEEIQDACETIVIPVVEEEIQNESETEEIQEETEELVVEESEEEDEEYEEEEVEDEEEFYEEAPRKTRWLRNTILILLALCLAAAGYFLYKNYYLQPVRSIRLEGTENSLTVYVESDIDETLLTVLCTDSYGHGIVAPVTNGKAVFSELASNTGYTVNVQISGFHKLTGDCSSAYSTPIQTGIVQLTAVTGATDGSVILSFRPDGPDSDEWMVTYWTETEQERSVSFPGHTVTLTDLTIGKEYSFRISPVSDLYVEGEDTILFTPSKRIFAQDLAVGDFSEGEMIVTWAPPEGITGINWIVQCSKGTESAQTLTTTENTATFTDLDVNGEYTVEVRAENMRDGNRIFVNKDSAVVSSFTANAETPGVITLSWAAAKTPADGWSISYTVDGIQAETPITTTKNKVTLNPVVPGAQYKFVLKGAKDTSVIGKSVVCNAAEAPDFSVVYTDDGQKFTTTASDITFKMCKRPNNDSWSASDISSSDYTTSFSLGQEAGFVTNLSKSYGVSSEDYKILFVIRDENGKLVCYSSVSTIWRMMWYKRVGNLSIPKLPDTPGNFHMDIYFNGALAGSQDFTIVS